MNMETLIHKPELKIDSEVLGELVIEVKETLAKEYVKPAKNFNQLDLWNIQRRKRNVRPRKTSL